MINNILNLKNSKIRIFPFQTRDHAFILYPDLPTSYLLGLLIDKIGFKIDQFTFDYIYPTKKCVRKLMDNVGNYDEDYFIFYLENYFHSSDYAFEFLHLFLGRIDNLKNKPKIIIHTIKTPKEDIKKLIEKYDFITLIVNGDFEEFFHSLFYRKVEINKIGNIFYRDDELNININDSTKVDSDLNDYLTSAYSNKYYLNFPKVKDEIISMVDEDDEKTNENIYYNWPREKYIKAFRYSPETSIMLTTGRGCKYNCSYCYRGAKYSSVRQISLETIKKDLDYLKELKYEYIYFYDDCFITTNIDRMQELSELLNKYDFEYGISARFEVCTPDNLMSLSKLNIKRIQIGLQSVSLDVNVGTKRGFKKEDFEKTLKNMKEIGISVSLDLILGLPGEGVKGFIKTFNYAVGLKPISIYINTLFLNPGTELYEKKEEYGIVTKSVIGKKNMFHVDSIKFSDSFSEKDIDFARKYVSYYINKVKSINIVLR